MGVLLGSPSVSRLDFDACNGRVDNDESGAHTSMLVSILGRASPSCATNTSGGTKVVSLAARFPITVFDTFTKQLRSSRSCRTFYIAAFNCPLELYYGYIKIP